MLSIGRVASGPAAVAYFTGGADARAAGCGVGCYTRDDTTAGRWVGSGAAALGLSGGLDPAGVRVLAGLLDGVGPDGTRLVEPVLRADPAGRVPALPIVTAARAALGRAGGRVDGRRAELDLTFSVPKSVSLLAAFAPSDVAGQVRAAHDAPSPRRPAKVDPDTVVAEALGRASPPVVDEQALTERLLGPYGLTEQATWFGYDDLLQAVCSHLPAGAPVDTPTLERLAARVLAHPDTIPLHDSGEQPRWTTRDLLAVEQHALATADRLHHSPAAPVDPLLVEYALRVHGLTGEQGDLVRTLTLHPGRLSVVVGPAGAGKTAALAAARTAWGHDDQLVLGCATAALAAQQLQHATGITSTTVAAILRGLQDPRPSGWLPPGGVLVVDEAGMVATRDLATLLAAAAQHHARLVLVGDPTQLPEIDAGGLFGHLARHADAALADNRRQQADWESDALAALRAGHTGPALGAYLQHGHVHIDPTPADRTDRIVEDYLMARQVAAAPSMTRETAYTALSRGRLGNYLYLTPDPDTPTPTNPDPVGAWIADTALAQTAHAIHRTSAHQLATDLRSVAVPPMGAERPSLAGVAHPEAPSSPRGLSI